ncbi:MAG: hypothetical protein CMF37_15165 [Leeuwenhoekiella sp.]|nr:hypothetical protein [Leeuwenhoekiella sp.]MBQ50242.1 hypothetical protein [Leeuwenhoekiella sp.]MBQ50439.1 hypothetical protein [Leeuwenhoekiella sp.]|tara:strand:+ start:480 stop:1046 length:567 start_codon:yes stop_codon:yes gene_type:complete
MASKPKHSNAFKLFNYPFTIWVANMYMVSEVEAREVGTFSTGNMAEDQQLAQQECRRMVTISKMVEIVEMGGSFSFINGEDAQRAYDIIVGHLSDWVDAINNRVNIRRPPKDDLRQLDALAAMIYKSARIRMVSDTSVPKLVQKLLNMSPMATPQKLVKDSVAKDHKHPITDMIADVGELRDIRRWRD